MEKDPNLCGFENCNRIAIGCMEIPVCHKHSYSTKEERIMEKEKIPPEFCPLCGKHKELPFIRANFGPLVMDICGDCNVVIFNLNRIITDTKRKMAEKL